MIDIALLFIANEFLTEELGKSPPKDTEPKDKCPYGFTFDKELGKCVKARLGF